MSEEYIIATSLGNNVKLWKNNNFLMEEIHFDNIVYCLAISQYRMLIAVADSGSNITIWRSLSESYVFKIENTRDILNMSFSTDCNKLVFVTEIRGIPTICIIYINQDKILKFECNMAHIAIFDPVTNFIITDYHKEGLIIYDIHPKIEGILITKKILHVEGCVDYYSALCFSDDNTLFASGNRQGTVQIWKNFDLIKNFDLKKYNTTSYPASVASLSFKNDLLLVSMVDVTILLNIEKHFILKIIDTGMYTMSSFSPINTDIIIKTPRNIYIYNENLSEIIKTYIIVEESERIISKYVFAVSKILNPLWFIRSREVGKRKKTKKS